MQEMLGRWRQQQRLAAVAREQAASESRNVRPLLLDESFEELLLGN